MLCFDLSEKGSAVQPCETENLCASIHSHCHRHCQFNGWCESIVSIGCWSETKRIDSLSTYIAVNFPASMRREIYMNVCYQAVLYIYTSEAFITSYKTMIQRGIVLPDKRVPVSVMWRLSTQTPAASVLKRGRQKKIARLSLVGRLWALRNVAAIVKM
jgi:hypothetical protein